MSQCGGQTHGRGAVSGGRGFRGPERQSVLREGEAEEEKRKFLSHLRKSDRITKLHDCDPISSSAGTGILGRKHSISLEG